MAKQASLARQACTAAQDGNSLIFTVNIQFPILLNILLLKPGCLCGALHGLTPNLVKMAGLGGTTDTYSGSVLILL